MVHIAPGAEGQRIVQWLLELASSHQVRPREWAFMGVTRLLLTKTVKFTEERYGAGTVVYPIAQAVEGDAD